MTEAEQVMKRCQIGTRNYDEANNLHAECYRVIGKLLAEHAMSKVQRLGQEIEQEPVAWLSTDSIGERHLCFDKPLDNDPVQPLYTSPPQRKPLTDEQIEQLEQDTCAMEFPETVRAIEAAHGIKE
jgi:hypothetical protein